MNFLLLWFQILLVSLSSRQQTGKTLRCCRTGFQLLIWAFFTNQNVKLTPFLLLLTGSPFDELDSINSGWILRRWTFRLGKLQVFCTCVFGDCLCSCTIFDRLGTKYFPYLLCLCVNGAYAIGKRYTLSIPYCVQRTYIFLFPFF